MTRATNSRVRVIGINPHIRKQRLAAARAVPALNPAAMTALRTAAGLFGRDDRRVAQGPGDLQRRARSMQRLFERTGAQESSFFAQASANTLETLRQGPKWAWRVRSELRLALRGPAWGAAGRARARRPPPRVAGGGVGSRSCARRPGSRRWGCHNRPRRPPA